MNQDVHKCGRLTAVGRTANIHDSVDSASVSQPHTRTLSNSTSEIKQ